MVKRVKSTVKSTITKAGLEKFEWKLSRARLTNMTGKPDRERFEPLVKKYQVKIDRVWQKSVEGIIEVGRVLIEAKEALPHGYFGHLNLPFSDRTAQLLMKIAANKVLTRPDVIPKLPPSWGTLSVLARVPEHRLEHLLESDRDIHPDMTLKDVRAVVQRLKSGIDGLKKLLALITDYPDPIDTVQYLENETDFCFSQEDEEALSRAPEWIKVFRDTFKDREQSQKLQRDEVGRGLREGVDPDLDEEVLDERFGEAEELRSEVNVMPP